jgi:hypothetical protein
VADYGGTIALHSAIDYGNGNFTVFIDKNDVNVFNMKNQTNKQHKN